MSIEEISFLGEFSYSLDAQRRVSVPKAWRSKDCETRLFLLPGPDKTVTIMPPHMFEDLKARARKISFTNAAGARNLARLASKACECVCDKQGRIAVSPFLKEYADLGGEVVMVGAFNTGQLMSLAAWDARQQGSDDEFLESLDGLLGDF